MNAPSPNLDQLSAQNPWPGLRAFGEDDREFFFGRERETAELLALIQRAPVVVVYGKSGLGKTSLIQAGLFPRLKERDFLPVRLRLDHGAEALPLANQIKKALAAELDRAEVAGPRPAPAATLWEYFHRRDVDLWGPRNRLLTPVIVLDQFEEAFTLGQRSEAAAARVAELAAELEALLEHRPPEPIRRHLEEVPEEALKYDFQRQGVRFVFSLREDFLPHLDPWRVRIPSLLQQRFRLEALAGAQGLEVVERAGQEIVDPGVARQIVDFVSASKEGHLGTLQQREVEPALLSLVCDELNRRRLAAGHPRITADLLSGEKEGIIQSFYERAFDGVEPQVRDWVEDELLTGSGYRHRADQKDAIKLGLPEAAFDRLVNRRILHREEHGPVVWLEFTHDLLTAPAGHSREARQHRREAEAAALREQEVRRQLRETELRERQVRRALRHSHVAIAVALVLLLLLSVSILAAVRAKQKADLAQQTAQAEAKRAERNAAESRRNLVRLYVVNGARAMDDGDLLTSLPWFVQAMKLEQNDPARMKLHRRRLDSVVRRCPRLAQVLFHEDEVICARFSPDGLHLLTASWDSSACVWDLATGRSATRPMKHFAGIFDAAFSPDGRRIVTGSSDQTARIWDSTTGEPLTGPLAHDGAVKAPVRRMPGWVSPGVFHVAFSPDGKFIATASTDGSARVWDAATGEAVTVPLLHSRAVRCVSFDADGRRIVTAGQDGTAKVWQVPSGQPVFTLDLRPLQVGQADFSPDGRLIATAASVYFNSKNEPGQARIWDAITGTPVTPPMMHGNDVVHIEFSPDGHSLVTASRDRTARVWNVATGEPLTPPLRHAGSVMYASFSPDGQRIATASADRTVRVWDAVTGAPSTPPLQHVGRVWLASFSPDGRYLVSASDDHCARVWDLAPQELALPIARGIIGKSRASFSADGRKIVTVSSGQAAQVWNVTSGESATPEFGQADKVVTASFSSDGRLVLTDNSDGTARIWDASTGQPAMRPVEHKNAHFHSLLSPDGRLLVTGSSDGHVQVLDIAGGRPAVSLAYDQVVTSVSFSPDSRRLSTASGLFSGRQEARLWDPITGSPAGPPMQHKLSVISATFSHDGRRLVTASWDKTARVWDTGTCKSVGAPMNHGHFVEYAEFSFDDRFVVTASQDRTARVWDATTGTPISPAFVHTAGVVNATFSPDGSLVVSDCLDGTARVWGALNGEAVTPPLGSGRERSRSTFSPDGRWVVSSRTPNEVHIWDVSRSERSLEDYDLLSQVLTTCVMDPSGGSSLLTMDAFQSLWRKLYPKQPQVQTGSKDIDILWHRWQAAEYETQKRWLGVLFHLKHLIDAEPQNQALRHRYAAAQDEFGMTHSKADGVPKDAAEAAKLNRSNKAGHDAPQTKPEVPDLKSP